MKFSIARSELLDSIGTVSKGLSARSTLPILSGILFSVADGELQLQSTDLEVSVRHTAPALVEKDGQAVIPGRLIGDIVRTLPEAAVSIETDGDSAIISCGQSSFTMKTLSPTDFPKFPEVTVESRATLPTGTLSAMVKQVSKAVSKDETRAVLTGILVALDGASLRLVATDAYRLAVRDVLLEKSSDTSFEVIVPGRALEEVTKLASASEDFSIGLSENQVIFEFGSTSFVTRRIEGTFPDYRKLILPEWTTSVVVNTEEFQAAVKRVSLMAQHNSPIRISVKVEDQTLSLSSQTQDVGDASEDLMVKATGEDMEIAFNHSFMMDALSAMPTENTIVKIENPLKQGMFTTEGDQNLDYVLMPVRLN